MSSPARRRIAAATAPWLAGAWLLARVRTPRPAPPGAAGAGPASRVSVLIPARNERRALPNLLDSLARQVPPPGEVIVVDDASDDGTGALARAAGATVIDSAGPPDGWSGKCWALHQAQQAATGDVLVLLDADVTLAPDGVARMVGELDRLGGVGLVSAEPYHRTRRWYEQLSGVCNVVALMGTGSFTAAGWASGSGGAATMAFGPCMVVDRHTYDLTGGHQHPDVRSKITEDLALARRVAAAGRPVAVLAGGSTVAFRMYPDGLGQAVNGWTKVLATGAGSGTPAVIAGVGLWVTGALLASAAGGRALAGAGRLLVARPCPPGAHRPLWRTFRRDVAIYGAWALQMRWLLRRVGSFGWPTALAFPLPLSFFVACFARSAVKIGLGRPLAWRGRALTGR